MTEAVPTAADLPASLVATPQWLCWREESRDGKPTKVPVEPGTDEYASATDPDTWRPFEAARAHAVETVCGLGFVFTALDRFVGVDLDDCRDPDTGQLTEPATAIVDRLDSYTEVSPSGTGVHVLVAGGLPDGRNRHDTVEMYDDARFFTVTGDHCPETPTAVARRPEALAAVHDEYVQPDTAAETNENTRSAAAMQPTDPELDDHGGNDLADDELRTKARAAANGSKFERLYRGSTAGYPSQSEADMALCALLAFWTGGDATQIDRLFRDSGLMRPKWDEQHYADGATYGERTIERAIAGTDEFYTGQDVRTPSASDTGQTAEPTQTPDVSLESAMAELADLREELETLQAKNERLRAELDAERAARQDIETAQGDDQTETAGLFSRLFG